jgi:peptidoglycan/LPS O-acetylase OafA/YrhL
MIPTLFTVIVAYSLSIVHLYYNGLASSITGSKWLASASGYTLGFMDVLRQGVWDVFFESPNQFISSFDNALWTISIEFMGSFLVFSFILLFGDLKNRWIFYLGAGLILLDTYYLAFIIGTLLSDLDSKNNEEYTLKNPFLKSGLFTLGLFLGSYYTGGWWGISLYNLIKLNLAQPSIFFRTIGAGILLLVILNSNCLKKMLNTEIPLFLGRISFTMYLLHLLVIYSVSSIIFIFLNDLVSYNVSSIITLMATLPVVLGVSCIAYRYVDEPGIRLSRKIYTWYFTDEPNPVDWRRTTQEHIYFAQKYLVELIVLETIIITAVLSFFIESK